MERRLVTVVMSGMLQLHYVLVKDTLEICWKDYNSFCEDDVALLQVGGRSQEVASQTSSQSRRTPLLRSIQRMHRQGRWVVVLDSRGYSSMRRAY